MRLSRSCTAPRIRLERNGDSVVTVYAGSGQSFEMTRANRALLEQQMDGTKLGDPIRMLMTQVRHEMRRTHHRLAPE